MEDIALGRVFRQVRIRRGWRQEDVAGRAHVSRSSLSEFERGHLDACSLSTLRRIAAVLEIRLVLEAGWRGGDLGRLVASRHSAMENAVAGRLIAAGWLARPEVSFNHLGERGVIDQVAFHPVTRTLLYDGPRRVPAELRVAADSRGREPVRGSTRPTVDPTGIWQVAPRPGADLVRARAGGRWRAEAARRRNRGRRLPQRGSGRSARVGRAVGHEVPGPSVWPDGPSGSIVWIDRFAKV